VTAALHRDFSFPLNVYAHALTLEHGQVEALHYGLFDTPAQSIIEAQAAHTALLFSMLPPPPKDVLEVGIGLGRTLARLSDRGDRATGITPDKNQVRHVNGELGDRARVIETRFEDFDAPDASFDVVVFQESAQYIRSDLLFSGARRLLRTDGTLIVLDEVPRALADMSDFSSRGFRLETKLDLTAKIRPTMDVLTRVIEKHKKALATDLGCEDVRIAELLVTLYLRRASYDDGGYAYVLAKMIKT
jgi:cyclopropane fatty-acyl-phospholipid synthase-like methyltransferase